MVAAKDRVVYLNADAYEALVEHLRVRPASRVKVDRSSLMPSRLELSGFSAE
jgi:hypothetical protein